MTDIRDQGFLHQTGFLFMLGWVCAGIAFAVAIGLGFAGVETSTAIWVGIIVGFVIWVLTMIGWFLGRKKKTH
jgi:putative Mn2+ efflux pump MntP